MANTREITYYDVSPYAALSAVGTVSGGEIQDFSDVRKLFDEKTAYRSIQTCEHNYTILNGEYMELSENEDIALWSKRQSADGTHYLTQSITLDISFGGLQSSPGISFFFDVNGNNWCDMLRIKWRRDGVILSDKAFYPNSAVYSCVNKVDLYNGATIQFMRMNAPGRYFRLESVLFGIIRTFGDGELENLTVNEGRDPTGRTIYINSANFTINTKDELPYMFLKRQPLHIRHNGAYMGLYYIDKSKRYADKRYSIEALDKIGVLDASDDFMGGMYDNISNIVTAENLIKQIIPESFNFNVIIDGSLKNIKITGWLPIMKRREALAQVAVAIGAVINTSRTNVIEVKPMPKSGGIKRVIDKDRVYQSAAVDIEFPYTGIELIEHNFTAGGEITELYGDVFSGEKTIKFSEPASNLTIVNGTVLYFEANYAIIKSANENIKCVLTGRKYTYNQNAVTVKTADMLEGTREKIEKIEDCYLVNRDNSQAVAQRLYSYYIRGNVFEGEFLIINAKIKSEMEQLGDTAEIATVFKDANGKDEYISGQIEKLSLSLGNKNIKAKGVIRGD